MAKDTRRNARIEARVPGSLSGPRGEIRGLVRNLSRGGGFLQVTQLFPVGQTLEMSIDLPDGPVKALGEVRYHHKYPDGAGMGIRFVRLGADAIVALSRFIDARLATEP